MNPEPKACPLCRCCEPAPGKLGDPHLGPVCPECYASLTATRLTLEGLFVENTDFVSATRSIISHDPRSKSLCPNLVAHFLDLRGLRFEGRGEHLNLFLLLGDGGFKRLYL